jgi:hypothetical protein
VLRDYKDHKEIPVLKAQKGLSASLELVSQRMNKLSLKALEAPLETGWIAS